MGEFDRIWIVHSLRVAFQFMEQGYSIKDSFRVLEEPVRDEDSIRLVLKTVKGPIIVWCAKWAVSLYRYKEGDEEILEAWVPLWLQKKEGIGQD